MKATQCTAILNSFSLSAVAQTATPQIASTPPRCSAICRSPSTAIRSRLSSPISKHPADERSRGQIQIEFQAELPSGGPNRRLTLENLHLSGIAALPGELSRPVRSRYSRCRAKTKRFAVNLPIGLRAGRCSFRFVFAWGPADRVSLHDRAGSASSVRAASLEAARPWSAQTLFVLLCRIDQSGRSACRVRRAS